eukprot:6483300-Amphidinium_carterae.1
MGFKGMTILLHLDLHDNDMSSTLPGDGLASMTYLKRFCIDHNDFAGSVPTEGLKAILTSRYLEVFDLSKNQLAGVLPVEGMLKMTALTAFGIRDNRFSGTFPLRRGRGMPL